MKNEGVDKLKNTRGNITWQRFTLIHRYSPGETARHSCALVLDVDQGSVMSLSSVIIDATISQAC